MNEDRNKTDLTKHVTRCAVEWLDNHGFKPVETEVLVANGWVADVASVICPTQTELVALKLLGKRPPWGSTMMPAWEAGLLARRRVMTALCEVKTSRSDFVDDRKWQTEPPTDLAYVAVPSALKNLAWQLPDTWGVLVVSDECLRLSRTPQDRQATTEQQRDVILQIAIRRDHDTRHERIRAIMRKHRAKQSEQKSSTKIGNLIGIIEHVVNGECTPEEAAARFGTRMPYYCVERLKRLAPKNGVSSV